MRWVSIRRAAAGSRHLSFAPPHARAAGRRPFGFAAARYGRGMDAGDHYGDGPRPMATEVDPRLVDRLAVFRRPLRDDDALPADGERMLLQGGLGANPALSRKARDAPDGLPLYLVPGAGAIYLVGRGGSGGGDDIDHALTGAGIGFQDCVGPRGGRILGLLPDDASDVAVTLADGTVVPLAVEGNVYAYDFPKDAGAVPQHLDLRLGGAPLRLDPPIPDDVLRTRCGPPGWREGRKPPQRDAEGG
jgi:hypothetical protein